VIPQMLVTGESSLDFVFGDARLTYEGRVAQISLPARAFRAVADKDLAPGQKTPAIIPDELWDYASDVQAGGGYVNSGIAIKSMAPNIRLRCVDACCVEACVRERLRYPHLELRGLDLRDAPRNVVLPDGNNRTILKQKGSIAGALNGFQRQILRWGCECGSVFANSVKHEGVMELLAHQTGHSGARLSVVLTNTLAFDFMSHTVLPVARVLFASWDEIGKITGWDVEQTVASATMAMTRLQRIAPQSLIFLTLGEEGVLVTGPGLGVPCQVRLAPGTWNAVQQRVAEDPARLCGIGDAFAGSVAANLECFATFVADLDTHHPAPLNAAISGCAAAARWLGFDPLLNAADFEVKALSAEVAA
jgi:hypothetical protein